MVRKFAVVAAVCTALACGGQEQDQAEATVATAAGWGWTVPFLPDRTCPSGYTSWMGEECARCPSGEVVVVNGACATAGTDHDNKMMCEVPTPWAILCANRSGMVSDPRTCNMVNCDCPAGQTKCNGKCVDVQSDAANCGSCGRACSTYAGGVFPPYCSHATCRTCTYSSGGYGGWSCNKNGPVCYSNGYGGMICSTCTASTGGYGGSCN